LPLSFAQQRLWFLDQLAPGNPVYNIFEALRIKGPLNARALEKSFAEIVERNEAVRTTFGIVDGQPVQIINHNASSQLSEIDLWENRKAGELGSCISASGRDSHERQHHQNREREKGGGGGRYHFREAHLFPY
jgi:hypothetical protein